MAHQLERLVIEQMRDIAPRAGEEIVDAKHVMSRLEQPLAEMRAKKTGAARDKNTFMHSPSARSSGLNQNRYIFGPVYRLVQGKSTAHHAAPR